MPLEYTDHIERLRTWVKDTATSMLVVPTNRTWCTFDIETQLTASTINDYFSNVQPNEDFDKEAQEEEITNVPVAQLQLESDHIHAINKMMVYRHQPRLKYYRDDLENKGIRTPTSIALSLAKLNLLKEVMKTRTT